VAGFGAATFPWEFQQRVDLTMQEDRKSKAYLDDLHVGTGAHIEHLRKVTLPALRAKNWLINLPKCQLVATSAPLLGYRVGLGGWSVTQKKKSLVEGLREPATIEDVVSCRCLVNWLGKRIPFFAPLSFHLNKYSRKSAKFADYIKDKEAQGAAKWTRKLLSTVSFRPPTGSGALNCYVDASDYGWGYILVEEYDDSKVEARICDVGHGTFSDSELYWTVTEK
ncbi:unnamed protein product, partial [Amoebophrya sp. A25]